MWLRRHLWRWWWLNDHVIAAWIFILVTTAFLSLASHPASSKYLVQRFFFFLLFFLMWSFSGHSSTNRLCFSTTLQSPSTALTSKKSEFLTDSSRCSLSESPSYFPFLASRALTVPPRLLAHICWYFPFQPHSAPLLSGRMFKLFPRQICLRHLLIIISFLFSPPLCQCFLLHPTESLLQSLLLGLLPLSFLGAALPLSSPRNRFLSPCDRCHWAPPGRAPRQLA